jgi:nucleoside-diphosphate-sugar epimerase
MKLAITGGTGFVGRHLAERFSADEVVPVSRRTGVAVDALVRALAGRGVVAHCAGINRMLSEGVVDVAPPANALPADLAPKRMFSDEQIRLSLPEPGGFGVDDLRLAHRSS